MKVTKCYESAAKGCKSARTPDLSLDRSLKQPGHFSCTFHRTFRLQRRSPTFWPPAAFLLQGSTTRVGCSAQQVRCFLKNLRFSTFENSNPSTAALVSMALTNPGEYFPLHKSLTRTLTPKPRAPLRGLPLESPPAPNLKSHRYFRTLSAPQIQPHSFPPVIAQVLITDIAPRARYLHQFFRWYTFQVNS